MNLESISVNLDEHDLNPKRKPFKRESVHFNFVPSPTYSASVDFVVIIPDEKVLRKKQMALAASVLQEDYFEDSELTSFTVLDSEPFYDE